MSSIELSRVALTASPAASLEEAGMELERALQAWRDQCEAGATALDCDDVEGVERALAVREALRPRIELMMGRVQRQGGACADLIASVRALGDEAAAADARLTGLLDGERSRLRDEIDTLRRGNGPVAAYRRPDAPSPHRLNIVR